MPKTAGKARVTALYERLSRDDDLVGESNSIINQKKYLEDYAHKNGLMNIRHYTDDGYSGVNFNRPGVQALITAVEAGEIDTICVKDLSRFGRNYLQVGFYTEVVFPQKNVRFIAINNGIDSNNATDNDFAPFLNIMNEFYAKDTSNKIKAIFDTRMRDGKRCSGSIPYGYNRLPGDKQTLVVDPEAAEVVKRMQSRLQRIPLEIQSYEQAREKLAADHASYMQNKAGDFSMTICGTRYAERKDAGAALLSACQAKTDPAPREIGAYRGFRLLLAYANMQFTAILKGEGSYSVELGDTAIGNIQRLEHQLERLAPSVKAADCKIDALKQEQQTLKADAEQPFPQEAELAEKSQRLIALDTALKLKTHADRVQDTEIDQEETPSQAREEYVR